MTTTHTPGPWKVEPLNANHVVVRAADGSVPANCPAHSPADAALIAAAPDLLAALKGLNHSWENGCQPPVRMWDAARAAIAKAEGGAK